MGSNSSLQAFLCSMLDPASTEDWRPERGQSSPCDWEESETHHSSLPDLTVGWPRSQASLTRPGYWQAGAQNLPGWLRGGSIGVAVEPSSGPAVVETEQDQWADQHHLQTSNLMVRGEDRRAAGGAAQPHLRRASSRQDLAMEPDRMSSSEKCGIVRPAMRLPRDLIEKMPSAPNTPVSARKEHVANKLASSSLGTPRPVTVASMVRR